ncbi:cation diffusion facilitator family transporter [Paucidesulfovibrio gracilis DSM 16080]|uniref:Cation diffusion facilitator family transporter n=1 Tax=Paucidesulfovibrio gracilis DSM 16080 TaxID=1121449 RepID=A0A1T4W8P6_9BACT|nr:cation diffusion facilitator family transporter [Paucidesulfovibrio gracilis]SKA73633.1 cation diffusion facilitator family transporter [Paucidesulfovibrio gracilis DSM 16080]
MASGSKRVIIAAMLGNMAIAATKFTAAAFTGSSAMLSEGVHSTVDTGNQLLLLHGLRQAGRPACSRFPFGRGKEIYFYSFVVAILIFGLGAGISIYEGILHLRHPEPAHTPWLNYAVLAASLLFEGAAWSMALREFRRTKGERGWFRAVSRSKNPPLFVVLFEDTAAMLGLLAAFAGVLLSQVTGDPRYDGAASIVIGLVLAGTAAWLAWETHGLLLGESAHPEVEEAIRNMTLAKPGIEQINELATLHMGPDYILVTLSVDFADHVRSNGVEQVTSELDRDIKTAFPRVRRVFIEAQSPDAPVSSLAPSSTPDQ